VVIAEIQQASDTTFRLYDWKRVGPDGQPRPLHIEQSLAAIDFTRGPVDPQQPVVVQRPGADAAHIEQLVACDKFVLERWRTSQTVKLGCEDRFHLLCVLEGEVTISTDPSGLPVTRGQSVLLPASSPALLSPRDSATFLVAYLPDPA
jgi:mannose-6-phosphate isomerase